MWWGRDLLYRLLAVWLWESSLTALSLSFPMWKMEMQQVSTCRDFHEDKMKSLK